MIGIKEADLLLEERAEEQVPQPEVEPGERQPEDAAPHANRKRTNGIQSR